MKLIDKDALVAEIEERRQLIFPKNTGEMKVADVPKPLEQGWINALSWIKKTINTLEVKEVDLEKEIEEHAICMPMSEFTHDSEAEDFYEWAKEEFRYFFELGMRQSKKRQQQ